MKTVTPLALPTFDLSDVMAQIASDSRYAEWSKARLRQAEDEYRQFLALARAYPFAQMMPSELGDVVWHAHILNTRSYAADVQGFLGRFLHHRPCQASKQTVDRANSLFEKHFGHDAVRTIATCIDEPSATISDASSVMSA